MNSARIVGFPRQYHIQYRGNLYPGSFVGSSKERGEKKSVEKAKGHPRFLQLLSEAAKLHEAKSADYGESNDPLGNMHASSRIGIDPFVGALVRMQDKMARIESLVKKGGIGEVKTESMVDTLKDLAAYSYLAIILWEEAGGLRPDTVQLR